MSDGESKSFEGMTIVKMLGGWGVDTGRYKKQDKKTKEDMVVSRNQHVLKIFPCSC